MDNKSRAKSVILLAKHLRTNCDKIFDRSIPFVIDSAIFWFITEAIHSLLSSDAALLPDACSNSNFYDYVMFLSDFFEQTPSLCITLAQAVKGVNSIPGNLDLTFFRSLHFLELRKIPPHMVTSLYVVKSNLRKLKCSRCIDSLNEILSSQQCSNNNSPDDNVSSLPNSSSVTVVWPELKEIDFSFNRISEIDQKATETFELTPLVENLNLSRNSIFTIDDTFSRVLNCLTVLNLNYNKLKVIPAVPPNVKTLLLSHNYINSLTCPAFQSLQNVEVLDLSTNMISDENELDALGSLRFIKNLVLLGNPVSFLENYRNTVCCSINRLVLNRTFVLDNKKLSISQVRRALESRKDYKFVPFNVAPTEEQFLPRPSTSTNFSSSSLTQSYDSTASSVRSSCPKKPKIRPVYVYDPDDDALNSKYDDKSQTSANNNPRGFGSTNISKVLKEGADEFDENSEIKILAATRNAIESLREKYGEENWLLKQAGLEVGKILKIPISSTQTPPSTAARLLSRSLPGNGGSGGLSEHSSSSFYTTATEFDDSRIFKSQNTTNDNNYEQQCKSSSSTSSTVQDDTSQKFSQSSVAGVNSSANATNDDSLIFYPCTSENEEGPFESAQDCDNGSNKQSSPTEASSSPPFRFSSSIPPPSFAPEIFKDPNGKAVDFRYFQAGQVFKLVILDNYLYEIDKVDSAILSKWDLKSLEAISFYRITGDSGNWRRQSIEKYVKNETETVEFKLTFDTMKKNLKEKSLVMSTKEFEKFDELVAPFLEQKAIQEFAEAFQCLRCNAQFSKGLANKSVRTDQDGQIKEVPICNNPDCSSELLVLLDTIPLPNNESLNVEDELLHLKNSSRSSSPFSGSSTVAKPIQDSGLFRVPLACSTPKPLACSLTNHDVRGSEQFIDQTTYNGFRSSSQTNYVAARKKSKSSSEPASLTVINAKSDSDIETLSCNSSSIEVIGNNGDSGSSSDIAEVQEAVEYLNRECKDETDKGDMSTCKHKSGKSGVTMTDSTSSGSCAESICTLYEKKPVGAGGGTGHPNSPTISTSISSSTATLLNQSQASQNSPIHGLISVIKFDYECFTKVDHRLQLFCEISVFKGSDERLLALAKVVVMTESLQFPSIVIFSNQKLYIYKIVGMEGDKPDSWLQKFKSFRLTKLTGVNVLLGRHGVGMDLQGKYYALVFRDSQRTSNFLEVFLGAICNEMELPPLVRDFSQTHKALLSPTDEVVYFGVLRFASCENGKSFATAAIMVTDVEVLLITELSWLAHYHGNVIASQAQQLNVLRQVESHENDDTFVRLIFGSANHVFWELYFESKEERLLFVTNLQPYAQGIPFISLSQPISITL